MSTIPPLEAMGPTVVGASDNRERGNFRRFWGGVSTRVAIPAFLVLIFLWWPILMMVGKGIVTLGQTFATTSSEVWWAFIHSLLLALASSILSTLMGTVTAFALPEFKGLKSKFLQMGLSLPLVLPEITLGISLLVWFGFIGLKLSWGTLLLGHFAFSFSYSTLILKARIEAMEKTYIDAARDMGANTASVFRHAIWPQIKPGVISSLAMCFSLSLDDFLISFFVKGMDEMTLPVLMFSQLKVKTGSEFYGLSTILFFISVGTVVVSNTWTFAKSPFKRQKK